MKRTIAIIMMLTTCSAFAHGFHGYYGHRYYGGGWVAPAIIGGVIGYEMSRPQVVIQQPPVIVQQPPIVVQQPVAPYGYHFEYIQDAACNCYKKVLVAN